MPPWDFEPGSCEYFFASAAKSAPAFSCAYELVGERLVLDEDVADDARLAAACSSRLVRVVVGLRRRRRSPSRRWSPSCRPRPRAGSRGRRSRTSASVTHWRLSSRQVLFSLPPKYCFFSSFSCFSTCASVTFDVERWRLLRELGALDEALRGSGSGSPGTRPIRPSGTCASGGRSCTSPAWTRGRARSRVMCSPPTTAASPDRDVAAAAATAAAAGGCEQGERDARAKKRRGAS